MDAGEVRLWIKLQDISLGWRGIECLVFERKQIQLHSDRGRND